MTTEDRIHDDRSRLTYPVPEGWFRVPGGDSGPSSQIAAGDPEIPDEAEATVLAGRLSRAEGRDLAEAALNTAKGWAQLSDAKANAVFTEEDSRATRAGTAEAATAALVAAFPGGTTGDLYVRVTLVVVGAREVSYLFGSTHPEEAALRADVDAVHDAVTVA